MRATTTCSPHNWITPSEGDDALRCRSCGRVLYFSEMEINHPPSILGAVFKRRRGDFLAFQQAMVDGLEAAAEAAEIAQDEADAAEANAAWQAGWAAGEEAAQRPAW